MPLFNCFPITHFQVIFRRQAFPVTMKVSVLTTTTTIKSLSSGEHPPLFPAMSSFLNSVAYFQQCHNHIIMGPSILYFVIAGAGNILAIVEALAESQGLSFGFLICFTNSNGLVIINSVKVYISIILGGWVVRLCLFHCRCPGFESHYHHF